MGKLKSGIVCQWLNRGQATVGRHLRDALEAIGHETYVLARPAKDGFFLPGEVRQNDVWDQEGVEAASHYQIPEEEYLGWARRHSLEVIWLDQNYQFPELEALRRAGHRTMGRFVWEAFAEAHVAGARAALDGVYALTDCEHERYRRMGIESRRIPWGIHPELLYEREREEGPLRYFYPGGFLSTRKPTGEVCEAFRAVRRKYPDTELVLKTQRPLRRLDLEMPGTWAEIRKSRKDEEGTATDVDVAALAREGIRVLAEDMPAAEYRELFASCDVCVAPSRWEGLGLHLWESLGYGLPVVCNDMAPLNEVVRDGENGFLTACKTVAHRPNGIPVMNPDIGSMSRAMERMADPGQREKLREGVVRSRERFRWEDTLESLAATIREIA